MSEPEFHEIEESLVAFFGKEGMEGVLVYRPGQGWLLHAAGSVSWDAWHQAAYRNKKSRQLSPEELKERGVPLPALPEAGNLPPLMDWEANFRSTLPLSAVPAPIVERLSEARDAGRVFVVLMEDLHESTFGDGKFLYAAAAYWDAEDARAFILRQDKPGFTVKSVKLRIDRERSVLRAELGVQMYEHYSIDDIVKRLRK